MTFLSRLFGQNNLIYIHTDRQQYYAGEQVSGTVILSVIQPLHVDGIYLKIYGYEETEFDVSCQSQKTDNQGKVKLEQWTERVRGSNTFFRKRYCIYSQKCTLASGNFVFPFQFLLDAKLPGTFEIYGQQKFSQRSTKASITYRVETEVAVPGLLKPNLYHSQDILICEPLRTALMSSDTYKECSVTFLCCIPKGTISMSANIDKNAYEPGDTVRLRLILDNSSSQVDLEYLSLKLVSEINLIATEVIDRPIGLDSRRICHEVSSSRGTIAKARSAGVKAGERVDRYIQLTLPTDCEPSTKSSLISCKYLLSVELKVPWSPDVVITQPVQIYASQRQTYQAHLQYPPDWAPSVFPIIDLQTMQYVTY